MNSRAIQQATICIYAMPTQSRAVWEKVFRTARIISVSLRMGDKGESSAEYFARKGETFSDVFERKQQLAASQIVGCPTHYNRFKIFKLRAKSIFTIKK